MGIIEQICFSLVSNKTKDFIRMFQVFKDANFCIENWRLITYTLSGNQSKATFYFENGLVTAYNLLQTRIFSVPQFDVRSFLNHFLSIISPSNIDLFHFPVYNEFDEAQFKSLSECLESHEIYNLHVYWKFEMDPFFKVINAFLPTKHLKIHPTFHRTLTSFQKLSLKRILTQKFQILSIFQIDISLDDLLLTNCSRIHCFSEILSNNDINLFLKFWMGGLKPELETFLVQRHEDTFNFDIILEGISQESLFREQDGATIHFTKIS